MLVVERIGEGGGGGRGGGGGERRKDTSCLLSVTPYLWMRIEAFTTRVGCLLKQSAEELDITSS